MDERYERRSPDMERLLGSLPQAGTYDTPTWQKIRALELHDETKRLEAEVARKGPTPMITQHGVHAIVLHNLAQRREERGEK